MALLRVALPVLLLLATAAAAAAVVCRTGPPQPNTGCTASKYSEPPAGSADGCCALCAADSRCKAWTFHPGHPEGSCYLSETPHCRSVQGATGGCDPTDSHCRSGPSPNPGTCEPVLRPPTPAPAPLPPGIKTAPNIVSILVDDLGFDDLRSHNLAPGAPSISPTVAGLLKEGVLLNRHHTYMWCSPTRRSFITGRYIVHITGEQAGTDTNLTPLQFTILSEKLAAANYENHFLGKGPLLCSLAVAFISMCSAPSFVWAG
jgi:hypothetical protein